MHAHMEHRPLLSWAHLLPQVKDAFRKLCLIYHPDKCSPDIKPIAEAKFQSIKDAYDCILKRECDALPSLEARWVAE
jgi:hypothetical protein